jgi:hypothetical protein
MELLADLLPDNGWHDFLQRTAVVPRLAGRLACRYRSALTTAGKPAG